MEDKKFQEFLENNIGKLTNCLITSCTVHDAIVASDGFVYEKTAFKELCKTGYLKSPVTREDMSPNSKPIKLVTDIIKFVEPYNLEALEQKYITSDLFEDNVDIICEALESNNFDLVVKFKSFKLDYICSGAVPFITKIISHKPKEERYYNRAVETILYIIENSETLDFQLENGQTILHVLFKVGVFIHVFEHIINKLQKDNKLDKLNHPDINDCMPIEYGIQRKDKLIIDLIRKLGFELKPVIKKSIHFIIQYYENIELIKEMINLMEDVNEIYDDKIPIITAIICKKIEIIEYLLNKNADISTNYNSYSQNAIHYAFQSGNNKIIKLIIEHIKIKGISLKISINKYIHTFIESCDDDQLVIQLLTTMDDINEPYNEATPLGTAIRYKKILIIKYLLEKGVSLDVYCYGNYDAINHALKYGNEEIINLILTHSQTQNIDLKHIFQLIESNNNNSLIINMINSLKDINEIYNNMTLLGKAIRSHNLNIINHLLNNKVDIKIQYGVSKSNAIYYACQTGNTTIAKLLIDKCDDINMELNDDGWRILHTVCYYGQKELIEYVLSKEPELNVIITNCNGNTGTYLPFNLIELNNNINESSADILINNLISLTYQ